MPEPIKGRGRYMAGLDGLRALAVLAVIAYHLHLDLAPGGLLGVGVFFVLSGYLITDLLVAEWAKNRRLDLKDFWLRRFRRLLPALLVMLIAVVLWLALFNLPQLIALRRDILSGVLYVSNWWYIFHQVSYFEQFGPPSPFGHLWSLAVEEQFYLLWPLALYAGLRFAPRRGPLAGLILTGAAASALAMALIYQPGSDPSRVYYGTDTRAFGLLIGSALALVWPSRKLSANVAAATRVTLDLAGGAGLFIILLMIGQTNQYDPLLYPAGLIMLSLAAAAVVAVLAHPASLLGRALGWKPLRWLGVRSYGIYLWHYPVIALTSPVVNTDGIDVPRAILQLAASIGLAALSWRFVEDPIRRGLLGRLWSERRHRDRQARGPIIRWTASAAAVCALLALGLSVIGAANPAVNANASSSQDTAGSGAPQAKTPQNPHPEQQQPGRTNDSGQAKPGGPAEQTGRPSPADKSNQDHKANNDHSTQNSGQTKHDSSTQNGSQATNNGPVQNGSQAKQNGSAQNGGKEKQDGAAKNGGKAAGEPTQTDSGPGKTGISDSVPITSGEGVTAFGDSVLLDVAPYLEKLLPGIVIDAKIGRQMSQAPEVVAKLKAEGKLGNRVIIELGTNGSFTKNQLISLLQSLGDPQQVILVNTRVPRPWEGVVNSTITEVAALFPHITLVDWYAASAGKSSFFAPDGVHLNREGAQFYASLLAKAIAPEPNHGKAAAASASEEKKQ
ncbi:acyltransferase family protein [Brevibacillus massiliensis]|uniref:acyltransferase family protein n=1 Tax=Brevibacillus massiliensis TaxID=1118054 RepID=UPI00030FB0A0|nr:acyltransferase family protein [Brevibacillus massiliensis]